MGFQANCLGEGILDLSIIINLRILEILRKLETSCNIKCTMVFVRYISYFPKEETLKSKRFYVETVSTE